MSQRAGECVMSSITRYLQSLVALTMVTKNIL